MREKIVIAVIVYNRIDNIRRWLNCWKQCDHNGAELIVIHNCDHEFEFIKMYDLCKENDVRCVKRQNIGFDIGAFQDVCRERLTEFPNDWDKILWITDDTIPMAKDFVKQFTDAIDIPGVGVSCMEVSNQVTPHVRTTGFCITKETARKLSFPADPIITKQHCYNFEHQGKSRIFVNQLKEMGIRAHMVAPLTESPLWDTHNRWKHRRTSEHLRVFPHNKKVLFICLIYNSYPEIISSLINQTHKNWELWLIHDGPADGNIIQNMVSVISDTRIKLIITPERLGNWGHEHRKNYLNKANKESDADYVVITNADNHHVPVFCEYMMNGFIDNPNALATYCDNMVHSYKAWEIIPCSLKRGFIDCAGVMVKKDIACEIGWRDTTSHSSDWTYFEDIAKRHGINTFVKVKGCLLVHN